MASMCTPVKKPSYKPYTLKDFNVMVNKCSIKVGGLGANIGTEEW